MFLRSSTRKKNGKSHRYWSGQAEAGIGRPFGGAQGARCAQGTRSDPPIHYLVGTPKGRLSKLEAELASLPWERVRDGIEVKLPLGHEPFGGLRTFGRLSLCEALSLSKRLGAEWLPQEGELYVFAQSRDRINKERAMPSGPELAEGRRRALRKLLTRLAPASGHGTQARPTAHENRGSQGRRRTRLSPGGHPPACGARSRQRADLHLQAQPLQTADRAPPRRPLPRSTSLRAFRSCAAVSTGSRPRARRGATYAIGSP